jgi:hypothetical protein
MNFLDMKTWNPASSSLWKEIVTRWGEDVYADSALREGKIAELKLEYESKQYQRQRATAYPPIADQLDQIYHEGLDAWKATILAVKEEFPE